MDTAPAGACWLDRAPIRRIVLALALVTGGLIATRLLPIADRLSLDPNEGWNAFQAVAAMGAGPLYPPPGALVSNNYPPLSFYLVGALGEGLGDMILAGRIVALASLLAVAGLVALIARRLTGHRLAAAVGALAVLLFAASVFRGYLAMNDPQWLSLALSMAGLAAVLWPATGRLSLGAAICSALLMGAALLVKHNALAIPAAAALYLLLHDRRSFAVWVALGLAVLPALWLLDRMVFEGAMIADITGAPRSYSLHRMALHAVIGVLFLPLLAASWRLLAWRRIDRRGDAILAGVAIATALAVVQGSGAGVDVNAWFEALAMAALALGAGLDAPVPPVRAERWAPLLVGLVALVLVAFGIVASAQELGSRSERLAASADAVARVAALPGPVACEVQALCYWAGKGFALDYFLYGERIRQTGSTVALDRALAERRIAAALIEGPADRVLPPAQAHILSRMRVVHVAAERRLAVLP
ncbi:dolichyl-phosphate-mannose-protein mannosyltransferase [Novosphingobium kunmingense]|uniref:Dolichyl-phosphate-mannose-protein mannosyltransferase n=1 Tax=Novosphingobium kunmingense TaxID=1211806 RepID=A0A2N0H678_9SPHN|nr:hypothetical protein [Novosphingobium kunmingense]PKB14427.1 dolichyl-phosphate-mannose-protein mannosyltransferase [Novosphingobium kunmingense]